MRYSGQSFRQQLAQPKAGKVKVSKPGFMKKGAGKVIGAIKKMDSAAEEAAETPAPKKGK